MDVIRDSAFFTTLLHCVLAYSLYPHDLPLKPYEVSSVPGSGILQTPTYDKVPVTYVTPSWQIRSLDNGGILDKYERSKNTLYQPGPTLKSDSQYPLTMQGAPLNTAGRKVENPAMNQNNPLYKPELLQVLNPSGVNYPSVYSQSEGSIRDIKKTQAYLAELSGVGNGKLLDIGYPHTNLGVYDLYRIGVKPYPYNAGLYYNVPGKAYTQSYQEIPGLILKPPGLDYLPTAPYTPSYKPGQIGAVEKPDCLVFPVTNPTPQDKNVGVVELPPVPTSPLPQLQRIRLALMNTVAGLPGGNTELLNSITPS